ncbi:unnamed protein product [Amoebophrya sp. A120]|nr:unnamed protein product [Amoebophrya sp. A120]|eukprot:GSA120T00004129001.1
MKFAKELAWLQFSGWGPFYLDYKGLKKTLKGVDFAEKFYQHFQREQRKLEQFLSLLLNLLKMRTEQLLESHQALYEEVVDRIQKQQGGTHDAPPPGAAFGTNKSTTTLDTTTSLAVAAKRRVKSYYAKKSEKRTASKFANDVALLQLAYENLLRMFFEAAEFAALNRKAIYKITKKWEKHNLAMVNNASDEATLTGELSAAHQLVGIPVLSSDILDFTKCAFWTEIQANLENIRLAHQWHAQRVQEQQETGSFSSTILCSSGTQEHGSQFSAASPSSGKKPPAARTILTPGSFPQLQNKRKDEGFSQHENSTHGATNKGSSAPMSCFTVMNPSERNEWDSWYFNSYWSRRWLKKNTPTNLLLTNRFSLPLLQKGGGDRDQLGSGSSRGGKNGSATIAQGQQRYTHNMEQEDDDDSSPRNGSCADDTAGKSKTASQTYFLPMRKYAAKSSLIQLFQRKRKSPSNASTSKGKEHQIEETNRNSDTSGEENEKPMEKTETEETNAGSWFVADQESKKKKTQDEGKAFYRYEGALAVLVLHIVLSLLASTPNNGAHRDDGGDDQMSYEDKFFQIFPVFRLWFFVVLVFWGVAWVVRKFERYGIAYVYLMDLDLERRVSSTTLFHLASTVSVMWALVFALFLADFKFELVFGRKHGALGAEGATTDQLYLLYGGLLTFFFAIVFPLSWARSNYFTFAHHWRQLGHTAGRCLVAPFFLYRPTFAQLLMADAFTSLASAWVDLLFTTCFFEELVRIPAAGDEDASADGGVVQHSICHCNLLTSPSSVDRTEAGHADHDGLNSDLLLLFLVCYPFLIRLCQCVRRFVDSDYKSQRDAMNSCKYTLAISVAVIIRYVDSAPAKVVAYIVGALATFCWDFLMDFGFDPQAFPRAQRHALGTVEVPSRTNGSADLAGSWFHLVSSATTSEGVAARVAAATASTYRKQVHDSTTGEVGVSGGEQSSKDHQKVAQQLESEEANSSASAASTGSPEDIAAQQQLREKRTRLGETTLHTSKGHNTKDREKELFYPGDRRKVNTALLLSELPDSDSTSSFTTSDVYTLRTASCLLPVEQWRSYLVISIIGRVTWPAATLIGLEQLKQMTGGSVLIAQLFQLVVGSFEIGRRAAWMVLRVEYEHLRNAEEHPNLCWLPLEISRTNTVTTPHRNQVLSHDHLGRNVGSDLLPPPAHKL